jgi:hypothetical protein
LVQRTKPEKDDSKDMDSLGEITAKSLIAKKIEQVDVIASSKIPVQKLEKFYRDFQLCNFEYT